MSVFLIDSASETVLPLTHSVASDELAIAEAAEGLELGFFDHLRFGIDLHLQLHDVAAFRRAHEASADVGIFLGQAPDVARIVVVIYDLVAICHRRAP